MMACIGRNWSPLFKLIKYKIVVFDEMYILFRFNIIELRFKHFIVYRKLIFTRDFRFFPFFFKPSGWILFSTVFDCVQYCRGLG